MKLYRVFAKTTVMIAAVFLACEAEAKEQKNKKPLKVVILAGQSNMQQPAGWQTLKGLADSPETKPWFDKLVEKDGAVRRFGGIRLANKTNDFPHGFAGQILGTPKAPGSFGPELGFGVTFHELVDEPVLIIKTAWGGKSLHTDFRPPTGKRWKPPEDHPDHPDNQPEALAIPASFTMPADYEVPERRGKMMQMMKGHAMGEVAGVHPIYINEILEKKLQTFSEIPFKVGDVILGVNGEGLKKNPVQHWREAWFKDVRQGDWIMKVTYWRSGRIDTVEIDTSQQLADGRDGIADYNVEQKSIEEELLENGGEYYRMMMQTIKDVLADPGKHHPAYDPKAGVELCGMVWFQGYNDQINAAVYPSIGHPRRFERYSWLLADFIRDVREELDAPELPFVIGVFGQGGVLDLPDPFRLGMAAPASYDEFKGTVSAVETAMFWDGRLDEISSREKRARAYEGNDANHPLARIQIRILQLEEEVAKKEKIGKKERKQLISDIRNAVLTPEDQAYYANNRSNQGFHYHGSPKFFVRTGEAFARSLYGLMQGQE